MTWVGKDDIGFESRGKSYKNSTWKGSGWTELNKRGIFKRDLERIVLD